MTAATNKGVIDKPSNHSVEQTVEKLKNILQSKGVMLSALVDHRGEAGLRKPYVPGKNPSLSRRRISPGHCGESRSLQLINIRYFHAGAPANTSGTEPNGIGEFRFIAFL
jgi:hypothetical protein